MSLRRVMLDYQAILADTSLGVTVKVDDANLREWELLIPGPADTIFAEGRFPATMTFPAEYPMRPPEFRFRCPMFHPNIYEDGKVCISILHPPGDDPTGYELATERWTPAQSAISIVLSIISILAAPNCDSPANVEASKMLRQRPADYEEKVKQMIDRIYDVSPGLIKRID